MGGNQSMHDCADILPQLIRLARHADKKDGPVSTDEITRSLKEYEDIMIERTSNWVKKSGGTEIPVGLIDKSWVLCARSLIIGLILECRSLWFSWNLPI